MTVSIIIPVYNGELYLAQAIDSCLNQSYRDIEIVIVDDGSTDNTATVVEGYKQCSNVTYIFQNNAGLVEARRTGVKSLKNEFFVFLDADDILEHDAVSSLVEEQIKGDYDVVFADFFLENESGKLLDNHCCNYVYGLSPKDMINIYKKLMTGTAVEDALASSDMNDVEIKDDLSSNDDDAWKNNFTVNPDLNEYGSKQAEIIDYAVVDKDGLYTSSIIKGDPFTIKYRVHFNEEIKSPIFTYTFRNVKGVDITGTNTMYERKDVEVASKGDEYMISFTQNMNLQGGEYLLSMSCTGYDDNGELTAYHRLYDLLNVTVVSDKDTVGFYDMNSDVTVRKMPSP